MKDRGDGRRRKINEVEKKSGGKRRRRETKEKFFKGEMKVKVGVKIPSRETEERSGGDKPRKNMQNKVGK